jgi:hypothetical protein
MVTPHAAKPVSGARMRFVRVRQAAMAPKVFHVPGEPAVTQTQPIVPPATGALL